MNSSTLETVHQPVLPKTDADIESSASSNQAFQPSVKELDKIYRHLDLRIIPALWCMYFLTSFGSAAYGNTLTMNFESNHSLKATLGLTAHDTSTASALYYVGYIIFDVPMNIAMTKLSPQVWLSRIVITVGLVYTCYAALTGPGGIVAIRFISGMCGAGTWPGMAYYISLWYPSDRTARRIGYYFTASQISASAAGLVAAGFQKMDMVRGYEGWKWLYIVYGSITVLVGILLLWWLPDRPAHLIRTDNYNSTLERILPQAITKWTKSPQPLTEDERNMHAIDMARRYKNQTWRWQDIVNVITDIRTWPLILMYFGVVGAGNGIAVFGTTLIKVNNSNLTGIDISLLYAPIWLFDAGGILIGTPLADIFKKWRPLIFCFSTLIIIVGLLVTTYAHGFWHRYSGLLICGFGLGPTVPICMTLANEIMFTRYGDVGCAVAAAIVSGLGNLGSVVSTYALYSGWPEDASRLYQYSNMMLIVILGFSIISCGALVLIRWFLGDFKEDGNIETSTDSD